MKKVKNALALATILVACYSCSKKDEKVDLSPTSTYDTPIPLKVGNYWVYDYFQFSYSYSEEKLIKTHKGSQKISVIGDTLIDGKKFYILDGVLATFSPKYDRTYISCNGGITSSNYRDTIPKLSTNFEAVLKFRNNEKPDNGFRYRQNIVSNDSLFVVGSRSLKATFLNETFGVYIFSESEREIKHPLVQSYFNDKVGIISTIHKYANSADQSDSPTKNDRYECQLIDYYIQ
jgi:hypothetical protein